MKRLFAESGVDDEGDESVDGLKRAKDKQPVAFPLVNENNRYATFTGYYFRCQETNIVRDLCW